MDSDKIQNWKKNEFAFRKETFSTSLEGNDLSISKFPELKLIQLAFLLDEERQGSGIPCGLIAATNGLDYLIVNFNPRTPGTKADARFSVETERKYSIPIINGYFAEGVLIAVSSAVKEVLEPYFKRIQEYSEPSVPSHEQGLSALFKEAIDTEFGKDSFEKMKEAIRNSNLPDDYRGAVKGIL